MFFRIWKKDPDFLIQNHIVEIMCNGSNLASIHQEYLNKPYEKYRSPWEVILVRNVNNNDTSEKHPTSFVVLRVHHVMADAKSLLKLMVECLGNKHLKTASPQFVKETRWDYFRFILVFPCQLICESLRIIKLLSISFDHPWKLKECFQKSNSQMNQMVIAFSPEISISKLKQVAKQNHVKT